MLLRAGNFLREKLMEAETRLGSSSLGSRSPGVLSAIETLPCCFQDHLDVPFDAAVLTQRRSYFLMM